MDERIVKKKKTIMSSPDEFWPPLYCDSFPSIHDRVSLHREIHEAYEHTASSKQVLVERFNIPCVRKRDKNVCAHCALSRNNNSNNSDSDKGERSTSKREKEVEQRKTQAQAKAS
jgi:hypothetical protein